MNARAALIVRPFDDADLEPVTRWFADEAALVQWAVPTSATRSGTRRSRSTIGTASRASAGSRSRLPQAAGAARGLGLARPFLRIVLDRVLANPAFERIELNVTTFNETAIRLYRSLGFVEGGIRRSAVRVNDDHWFTALYGLLRRDLAGRTDAPSRSDVRNPSPAGGA